MIVLRILLWILLAILLLLLCVLCVKIKVDIRYGDGVCVRLRVLFFRFTITPREKKPVNIKKFTYKKHQKRLKQDREKAEAKALAEEKKAREKAAEKLKPPEPKKKGAPIMAYVRMGLYLAKRVPPRLFRCFSFDFRRLVIDVGADDAAKTAIRYGYISQTVAYLLCLLQKEARLSRRTWKRTHVHADFMESGIKAEVDMTVSIRLVRLIPFGLYSLIHFLKAWSKVKAAVLPDEEGQTETAAVNSTSSNHVFS